MMPSVLRVSGRDIERNGVMTTPRALVSTCEVQPCALPAVFGERTKDGFKTWCRAHLPKDWLTPSNPYMGE